MLFATPGSAIKHRVSISITQFHSATPQKLIIYHHIRNLIPTRVGPLNVPRRSLCAKNCKKRQIYKHTKIYLNRLDQSIHLFGLFSLLNHRCLPHNTYVLNSDLGLFLAKRSLVTPRGFKMASFRCALFSYNY